MSHFRIAISSRSVALAIAGALLAGTAVHAETRGPATAGGASQSEAKAEKPKKYCARSEFTGTRLPRKVCKTEAEWRQEGVEIRSRTSSADQRSGRQG